MPEGGNPNIAEYAKGHRFGEEGGADPREAQATGAKPYSIRNSVRRLCAANVKTDEPITRAKLAHILGSKVGEMTIGQMLAAKKIDMALKGSEKMMTEVTNDVDGKLIERKVEAKTTLEDLINGTFDSSKDRGEETA